MAAGRGCGGCGTGERGQPLGEGRGCRATSGHGAAGVAVRDARGPSHTAHSLRACAAATHSAHSRRARPPPLPAAPRSLGPRAEAAPHGRGAGLEPHSSAAAPPTVTAQPLPSHWRCVTEGAEGRGAGEGETNQRSQLGHVLRAGNLTAHRPETLTSKEPWIGNGPFAEPAGSVCPRHRTGPLSYGACPGPQPPVGTPCTPLRLFPEP